MVFNQEAITDIDEDISDILTNTEYKDLYFFYPKLPEIHHSTMVDLYRSSLPSTYTVEFLVDPKDGPGVKITNQALV